MGSTSEKWRVYRSEDQPRYIRDSPNLLPVNETKGERRSVPVLTTIYRLTNRQTLPNTNQHHQPTQHATRPSSTTLPRPPTDTTNTPSPPTSTTALTPLLPTPGLPTAPLPAAPSPAAIAYATAVIVELLLVFLILLIFIYYFDRLLKDG
ncbi:hypothetical protein B0T10DRAFT_325762 [Thelonectria olida]|uniref:Uncharacterized protein n=1 Tax=Thelonectria olida TaxID=1576542 RepID=A0A9P8VM31_9HYPO|nr:hypothetical protein B0T10DRAFT_325762 [Thelonectria olida]